MLVLLVWVLFLAGLCVASSNTLKFIHSFNLANTFCYLFSYIYMSSDSHMKKVWRGKYFQYHLQQHFQNKLKQCSSLSLLLKVSFFQIEFVIFFCLKGHKSKNVDRIFWFDLKELYCQIHWCLNISKERTELMN